MYQDPKWKKLTGLRKNDMGEDIKYCRQCGKQLNIDAKFCRYCGYQFEAVQKVKAVINPCPQCGKDNARGAKFCRFCGAGLAGAEAGAAAIHAKSYATRQEAIPQMPELRMVIGFLLGAVLMVFV